MTEKEKLFKTLITHLMVVYTFCWAVLLQTRTKTHHRLCCSLSPLGSKLTYLPATLPPANQYIYIHIYIFYIPRNLLIPPHSSVTEKWIIKPFYCGFSYSVPLRSSRPLLGKTPFLKVRNVFVSIVHIIYFFPSLKGTCQNPPFTNAKAGQTCACENILKK